MKLFKKLAALVVSLTLLLTVGIMATACGGSGETTYTVTLLDESGNAVEGAYLGFCTVAAKVEDEVCYADFPATDANGVASYTKKSDTYHVKVLACPVIDETKYKTYSTGNTEEENEGTVYTVTAKENTITIRLVLKEQA